MADGIIYLFDIFGTAIFAITGAVKGVRNRLDFLGVIVFAITVGCGGGMLRDVLLDLPVACFWTFLLPYSQMKHMSLSVSLQVLLYSFSALRLLGSGVLYSTATHWGLAYSRLLAV